MPSLQIQVASNYEASAMHEIYKSFVDKTFASFEYDAPTLTQFQDRVRAVNEKHLWLVGKLDSQVKGYAYAGPHRSREGYKYSVETSVYVNEADHGQGFASQLYEELFRRLEPMDYYHAYAGITLPNDGSVALHKKFGFAHIGTFPKVGYKFGKWLDVTWWHRELKPGAPDSNS